MFFRDHDQGSTNEVLMLSPNKKGDFSVLAPGFEGIENNILYGRTIWLDRFYIFSTYGTFKDGSLGISHNVTNPVRIIGKSPQQKDGLSDPESQLTAFGNRSCHL